MVATLQVLSEQGDVLLSAPTRRSRLLERALAMNAHATQQRQLQQGDGEKSQSSISPNGYVFYPYRTEKEFLRYFVEGHKEFKNSIKEILWLLRKFAKRRYKEVLTYLPQAIFRAKLTHNGKRIAGLSSGYFSQDGIGQKSRYLKINQRNGLKSLLKVVLHETGHNVYGVKKNKGHNQQKADWYAYKVLEEMIENGYDACIDDFYFGFL